MGFFEHDEDEENEKDFPQAKTRGLFPSTLNYYLSTSVQLRRPRIEHLEGDAAVVGVGGKDGDVEIL